MFQKLGWALALMFAIQTNLAGEAKAEGRDVGNGGGVWACREGAEVTGALRWVRLVDIDEAVGEWGLTLSSGPTSIQGWLDQVSEKIRRDEDPGNTGEFLREYTEQLGIVKQMIRIQDGRSLPVIDDALYMSTPAPETCVGGTIRYEQLANYNNYTGIILVDGRLYALLSDLEKAALHVHEAVYALMRAKDPRGVGADSRRARRITGLLFSDNSSRRLRTLLQIPSSLVRIGVYAPISSVSPPQGQVIETSSFFQARVSGSENGLRVRFLNRIGSTHSTVQAMCIASGCTGLPPGYSLSIESPESLRIGFPGRPGIDDRLVPTWFVTYSWSQD